MERPRGRWENCMDAEKPRWGMLARMRLAAPLPRRLWDPRKKICLKYALRSCAHSFFAGCGSVRRAAKSGVMSQKPHFLANDLIHKRSQNACEYIF